MWREPVGCQADVSKKYSRTRAEVIVFLQPSFPPVP
jgi:hypothetical protein